MRKATEEEIFVQKSIIEVLKQVSYTLKSLQELDYLERRGNVIDFIDEEISVISDDVGFVDEEKGSVYFNDSKALPDGVDGFEKWIFYYISEFYYGKLNEEELEYHVQ